MQFSSLELHDPTPSLLQYGFASRPFPGADAVVIFLNGDRSKGVVVAVGDQRYRFRNLVEGEVAISDDLGQAVHLTRSGIVVDGAGNPITIQNAPTITMSGTLTVAGDVIAGGVGGVSLLNHLHRDAGGTGESGPPVAGT